MLASWAATQDLTEESLKATDVRDFPVGPHSTGWIFQISRA